MPDALTLTIWSLCWWVAKLSKVQQSTLRIIAGRWRGRKLSFAAVDDLRPTPDRVRETLFNWLQSTVGQAHCLDLFAGSGALGFEAASRGADSVTLVEKNKQAAEILRENCQLLSADNCQIVCSSAEQFLTTSKQQYDIIFLDPPYKAQLWTSVAEQLMKQQLVAPKAYIYLECPANDALPKLPQNWLLRKDKKAGAVRYCLFQNEVGESS